MKKIVLFFSVVLMLGTVSAFDTSNLDEVKQEYNNQTDQVPGFVGNIVGGERVNFNIDRNGSEETIGLGFEGKKIQNVSETGFGKPTVVVNVSEQDISTVVSAEKPYQELEEKLDENEITYETRTFGSSVKITVLDTVRKVASALGISL